MAYDQYYNSVSLLLHCDGTNGSTTFTDSGPLANTVTANGNAQVSTAQSKFGGAAGACDGTGDYLSTSYVQANFDWWSSDYTLEFWLYANDLSTFSYTDGGIVKPVTVGCANATSTSNYWSFGPISGGTVRLAYFNGSQQTVTSTATVSAGVWNHIALVKDSSGIRIYVNGVGSSSTAVSGTPQSSTSGVSLLVGQINSRSMNGYIDDLRITKGAARYTSNFSVPTAAFADAYGFSGDGAATYTGSTSGTGTFIRYYEGITETAAATDPPVTEATLYDAIKEIVLGAAATDVSASLTNSVTEAAAAIETLIGGKLFQEALTEAATGDTSSLVELSFAMLEQAQASETSTSQWVVTMNVAEAVTALALVSTGYGFDVVETAGTNDSASQYVTMLASLLEEATATDTPTEGLSITVTAQETAAGMDSTATLATLLENLTEDAVGAVTLRLGDDVFTGWLLNTEEGAVSQFQNYDFNSFCQLRGEYYAAGADGIYRLGGTSDAGEAIVGYLKTGLMDFGSSMQKRMDSAWLAVATDGTVRMKVVTTDRGEAEETWYQVVSKDDGAVAENVRLKIGMGLKSRHWQFGLVVEDATEFELEEMQLIPMILSRRR